MREIGRPRVRVHFTSGTREDIARNRKNVESALQSTLLRRGDNRKPEMSWDQAPMEGEFAVPACRRSDARVPGE
jgi:hypothetical protein